MGLPLCTVLHSEAGDAHALSHRGVTQRGSLPVAPVTNLSDKQTGGARSPPVRGSARFQGENFGKNLELVRKVKELAAQKGCTPSQLALAWVLAQGEDLVPIPGTKRRKYLEENLHALEVPLSSEELKALDAVFPPGAAAGARYPEAMMKSVNR